MSYELLVENLTPDQARVVITEAVEGPSKQLWIQGIFMQAEVRNHNKRNYPLNELKRVVTEANSQIKQTNGICGELDHPSGLEVNLDRASHVITEYSIVGNDVYGKAKILEGPLGVGTVQGNNAAAIIRAGVRLGVSSRGAGVVNESTGDVSDYSLITCDIVATPSAPRAYPKAVMEALEYASNVNKIMSLSEAAMNDPTAQKYFQTEILKAVNQLVDKGIMSRRTK